MSPQPTQKLIEAFYEAALFLQDKIIHGGWAVFSSNYLREHVRCRYGYAFSNSLSPRILDEVKKQHPELALWITTNARKYTVPAEHMGKVKRFYPRHPDPRKMT
jgi:hypothetical protein